MSKGYLITTKGGANPMSKKYLISTNGEADPMLKKHQFSTIGAAASLLMYSFMKAAEDGVDCSGRFQ